MLGTVDDWLRRLYPNKIWGQLEDALALESAIAEEDIVALSEELQGVLKAATIFRPGSEEDLCDYIYILCIGREPCALQFHYGAVPLAEELGDDDIIQELYLRIAISSIAPLAVVQQVSVHMAQYEGRWMLREELRGGVYDAPLLKRMQRVVSILPAYGLCHVDMGEISSPPQGFDHGDYQERYGSNPDTTNYLFYRNTSTTVTTTELFLPRNCSQDSLVSL